MNSVEREQDRIENELSEYRIKLGAPLLSPEAYQNHGTAWIGVPKVPHVFFSKRVHLKENNLPLFTVENAIVMMAHGLTSGAQERNWYFQSGKQVSKTVRAYEETAKMNTLPHLDVLLICRPESYQPPDTKARLLFTTRGIPYIYADSTVGLYPEDQRDRLEGWLKPGEGVELITANADRWEGLSRWYIYWQRLAYYRERRIIPDWAKQPRI